MKLKGMVNKYFFNDGVISRKDIELSRRYFLYEGCTAVGIFSITSGAFLAGFAKYLGATDEFNGIIGAIPTMAGIFQILASMVFEKLKHRKLLIVVLCFVFRLLLAVMIFIPVFIYDSTWRLLALAVFYFLAYSLSAFITPAASSWIVDLTPQKIRGSYFAMKDAYSLAFVTILTLVLGWIMDTFRDRNNEYGGFIILALIVIILAIFNFYFLAKIKEPVHNRIINSISLKNVILVALKNKGFRKVINLSVMWNIALQIGGPFFAVYMVTGLKLSYSYIMIMGVLSSIMRVLSAKTWGNLADRISWAFTTKISIGTIGVIHFIWVFVNENTAFLLVPFLHVLAGIGWAGVSISLFNIQFDYAPEEGRTAYLGTSAALGGVFGFLSTYVGSVIINLFKKYDLSLTSFKIGEMQVVFGISGICLILTALYVHFFMKQKNKLDCKK